MTRSPHTAGWLCGPVAVSLVLAGCSGGTASGAGSAPAPDAEIVAEGEGVELNEFGGEELALGDPVRCGTIDVGLPATLETLDPRGPMNSAAQVVAVQVYDTLLALDAEGLPVPALAESMTSEDDRTWTMTLPEGVSFHDGTPFTAGAVISYLEQLGAPGSQSQAAGDVRQITSMSAPDEHTVVFELAAPWAGFPKIFTRGSAAHVPSPTALGLHGDQFGQHPVGAGPFEVASFAPGGSAVLVRNDDYRLADRPYLDGLTFVPAVDSNARLAATSTGDLDVSSTQSAKQFAEAEAAGLTVLQSPTYTYTDLLLNLTTAPFDDVRFREALIRAIDLEGLNQAVFDGLHAPMTGLFPKNHPLHEETGWPTHDPAVARELVEEYTADTGVEPRFTLTVPQPPDMQQQGAVIQQMLADVGITAELVSADQPTMVTSALAGTYDAQLRYIGILPETDRVIEQNFSSGSAGNNAGAGDPAVDELIETARTATADERPGLYAELQHEMAEWLPFVPLIQNREAFLVGPDVAGLPGGTGHGVTELLDYSQVWVAECE